MKEAVVLSSLGEPENGVDAQGQDSILSSLSPDSPHSIDSGMADSPDNSMPGSPAFFDGNDFSEQDSECNNVFKNQSVVTPAAILVENMLFDPAVLHTLPCSPPVTPTAAQKTHDEKSVHNLLELLVSSKSTSEPVLKLLSTIIGNSFKKDSTLKSQLTLAKKVSPGIESRKRHLVQSNSEIPAKEARLDVANHMEVLPSIVIIEQPEQNYRARYESEGCRGPVHGSSDMTFPTIKVDGYSAPLWVTVYLATNNGTPHFHLLCGPGSTKLPCRNIMLPGDVPAVQVLVTPENEMTAVLDCISLKRRRNFEADRELKRRGLNPADWKSERKEACFVFSAEIQGSQAKIITCKSRVFQCTAPPGNPEIWWMKPDKCSVLGGEEIGLIGKKFPKGFKVRFFGSLPSGEKWEAYGEVDRAKCNQGAGVVKSPRLQHPISSPLTVNVEICSGKGNNQVSSDSFDFTYLPTEKPSRREHEVPAAYDILPENLAVSDLIDAMAHFVREPANSASLDAAKKKQEWEDLSSTLNLLHQRGGISAAQLKEIEVLVAIEDTILLQAFRSTRKSFSESEFLDVFRHYLSGLTVTQ